VVAGVIPAAGAGLRLGGGVPKAWRPLHGRPMVAHAVDLLATVCDIVVVAAPPGFAVDGALAVEGALVVEGGATRTASVRAALAVLGPDVGWVLVHDAARPSTPTAVAARVLGALQAGEQAVVPVLPVTDTIKQVDGGGYVVATPDRAMLRAVQTPQGFERALLDRAYALGVDATDDAALVETLGVRVATVDGDPAAAKITTPDDLAAAEAGTRAWSVRA
jgi:2-C-methyl-D-erythritol 4-phosphate cytidylyltransferase